MWMKWVCGAGTLRRAALPGVLTLVLVTVLAVAACGGGTVASTSSTVTNSGDGGGAGGAQVAIKDFAFQPATVTIKAGESVTWTNDDSAPHDVVGDKGEFESNQMAGGEIFSFKFDAPGTYAYHCGIHPSMTGSVVVQ